MTSALIMAGGLGLRMRPLTEDRPKPMIEVGGRPIIERIVESLAGHGIRKIHVSLGYMGEAIEAHFGDGSAFGCDVRYLREDEALGTAGVLRLLPDGVEWPLVVVNGDILAEVDYTDLVARHVSRCVVATVCAREHLVTVPYGVIGAAGDFLTGITEKPVSRFLVSAGIYVLSKEVLAITYGLGRRVDMPDVLSTVAHGAGPWPLIYRLEGKWMDIGNVGDLRHAEMVGA